VSKQTRRKAEREAVKRERVEARERQQRAVREAGTVTDAPEAAGPSAEPRKPRPIP